MYDQGWSQVNSAYNFVNKELTNPENVKSRDIFLKQAKDNLKNLSSMDLSQHQNVMSANGVFQPWVNNTKALGDAALTSHWKQQEQVGEGYRLNDGGKFFNQKNVDYVKKQRMAFANDAADSWQDYYQNKRSYTPYHDYHKHVQELMKDFKPSSYKIDKVNGLYKYTDENASWTQAEIRKYLDANLSDQDKQQMKIEGDVMYNNSPQQMGQIFVNMAKNEMTQFDAGIQLYNKKLASATKPDEIKELKEYISNLEDRKKALSTNVDNINKGDLSFIKKKGEELAYGIMYNQYINKVSNGWSHADITHKISGDDVGLTIYREKAADRRQERSFEQQKELAMLKGEIAPPAQLNEIQISDDKEVSLSTLNKNVDDIHKKQEDISDMNRGMVATWKASLPENKGKSITLKDVTDDDITAYRNKGFNGKPLPVTHLFRSNERALESLEFESGIAQKRLNNVVEKIKDSYTPEKKQELANATNELSKLGTIKLSSGVTISAGDIVKALNADPNAVSSGYWGSGVGDISLKINGKTYSPFNDGKHSEKDVINFVNFVTKVKGARSNQKIFENYDNDIKKYFKDHQADLKNTAANVLTFSKGSYEANTLEKEMYNIFPEAEYSIQHAGLGSDPTNQGSAYFYISNKSDTPPSTADVTKYLQQRGYKDVVARTQTGGPTIYEIKNYKSPITSQYNQYNPIEKLVLTDLANVKFVEGGGMYQTGAYTSKSNRKLMITKDHNLYYLMVEGLNDNSSEMQKWPNPFTNASDAVLQGQLLTAPNANNLPEAQLRAYQSLL
jgi:hypothetical protein